MSFLASMVDAKYREYILHLYLMSLFLFNIWCEIETIYIAFVSHQFNPF